MKIYQFDAVEYHSDDVQSFDQQKCAYLADTDSENVAVFDLDENPEGSLERILNDSDWYGFDAENCWFRVFN